MDDETRRVIAAAVILLAGVGITNEGDIASVIYLIERAGAGERGSSTAAVQLMHVLLTQAKARALAIAGVEPPLEPPRSIQ